jgi:hypothetical protein
MAWEVEHIVDGEADWPPSKTRHQWTKWRGSLLASSSTACSTCRPPASVVDTVNTTSTPQLLDLREIENAKRVQYRPVDVGFLFGAADGIWGQPSRGLWRLM